MTDAMATTISRRAWLPRLLMAAAMVPVAGVTRVGGVGAKKKTKKQQKKRVQEYKDGCEADGGTAEVVKRPGGTTVTCTGGKEGGDWACTVSSGKDRCHKLLTNPPTKPAGGGAVPPSGGNEDPTDGGGTNPGGGAHVPPSGGVDPTGGGSDPVLE